MGYKRKILEGRKISRDRKKHIDKNLDYKAVKRQCLNKVAYVSEKKVLFQISEIAEAGRRGLRYYQCPICELWHISSHAMKNQKFVS